MPDVAEDSQELTRDTDGCAPGWPWSYGLSNARQRILRPPWMMRIAGIGMRRGRELESKSNRRCPDSIVGLLASVVGPAFPLHHDLSEEQTRRHARHVFIRGCLPMGIVANGGTDVLDALFVGSDKCSVSM